MQLICSHCQYQTLGPPELNGTRCPECSDGELGSVGRAPIETVLAVNGWAEAPLEVFTPERREYIRRTTDHIGRGTAPHRGVRWFRAGLGR